MCECVCVCIQSKSILYSLKVDKTTNHTFSSKHMQSKTGEEASSLACISGEIPEAQTVCVLHMVSH